MKPFQSILLTVRNFQEGEKLASVGAWLASMLDASIHILIRPGDKRLKAEVQNRLCPIFVSLPVQIKEGESDDFVKSIMVELESLKGSLVLSTVDLTESGERDLLDSDTVAMIERAPVPILLIPRNYEENLPWASAFVPMSGEPKHNHALRLALELAGTLDIPVDIVHVAETPEGETDEPSAISGFSDSAYHELPEMIDAFIAEATPYSAIEDKQRIRVFSLCRGNIGDEITKELKKREIGFTAIQWKGNFTPGHARTLKSILREIQGPLLLVKEKKPESPKLRLKTGEPHAA